MEVLEVHARKSATFEKNHNNKKFCWLPIVNTYTKNGWACSWR
jgi:hypothetical protein